MKVFQGIIIFEKNPIVSAWSNLEVELIVADYFEMFKLERSGQAYSKAEHRRRLLPLLHGRSEGSIEFKHQNISAALIRLNLPYIKGYLPRFNIQQLLMDKVIDYISDNPELEILFRAFSEQQIDEKNKSVNFNNWLVEPPQPSNPKILSEPETEPIYSRNPIKINYLEREQQNTQLGKLGEQLVIDYEQWFLRNIGKEQLADRIEWISKNDDGAGFDILSFNSDGSDKYIEVKTTKLGKETPFFFSKNELNFSQRNSDDYHLFRLFNFDSGAKIFVKNGSLDVVCQSEAVSFRGWF